MSTDTNIPTIVLEAFPVLSEATFTRQLSSPVPLIPDTIFDIYAKGSQEFVVLVTTDYADPLVQSQELKDISGQHQLEFVNLVEPYGKNGETLDIFEHDEMDGNFFVTAPYENYKRYYYLANAMLQT